MKVDVVFYVSQRIIYHAQMCFFLGGAGQTEVEEWGMWENPCPMTLVSDSFYQRLHDFGPLDHSQHPHQGNPDEMSGMSGVLVFGL